MLSRLARHELSAYCEDPQGLSFETQLAGEKIILLLRQHLITNLAWMTVAVVLALLPFILQPVIGLFAPEWARADIARWQVWLGWVWYLALFGFVFTRFLWWYFNIYLLTNERAVDVDFVGLLYKRVSDAPLSKIQDVTYKVSGVMGIFFHYGDVFIQTAGEEREFDFHAVPNPDKVAAKISENIRLEEGEPPGQVI